MSDYARFPQAVPRFVELGLRSVLVVPLRLEQAPFGVLGLASPAVGHFTERQVAMLQAIADAATVALTRARALQRAQEEAQANACLYRVAQALAISLTEKEALDTLTRAAAEEFGSVCATVLMPATPDGALSAAAVFSKDPVLASTLARLTTLPPLDLATRGPAQVFATGTSILVEDFAQDPDVPPDMLDTGARSGLAVAMRLGDQVLGVLALLSREPRAFTLRHQSLLETIAAQGAVALQNARNFQQAQESLHGAQALAQDLDANQRQLQAAYRDTIHSLVLAVEARDPYTRGHGNRVRRWVHQLARILGYPESELETLAAAAELHDVGKIGISDLILLKPDRLTPTEMAEVQRHPEIGADLVRGVPFLARAVPIIRAHHEHWDSKGYPDALAGEAIPWGARLLALPDTYDAMTTDRPYRRALTQEEAMAELREGAGTQFDPTVVETFLDMVGEEVGMLQGD